MKPLPPKKLRYQHEEHRYENQVDKGGRNHPARNGRANGVHRASPGARCHSQGKRTEEESQRGHNHRSKPDSGGRQCGLHEGTPLMELVADELDDQDSILRGKTHRRQETNLEIDVVGQTAEIRRRQCTEDTQGQHEQVDEGDRPALVKGGHTEENHEDREGIKNGGLCGGHSFLIGNTSPIKAHPWR